MWQLQSCTVTEVSEWRTLFCYESLWLLEITGHWMREREIEYSTQVEWMTFWITLLFMASCLRFWQHASIYIHVSGRNFHPKRITKHILSACVFDGNQTYDYHVASVTSYTLSLTILSLTNKTLASILWIFNLSPALSSLSSSIWTQQMVAENEMGPQSSGHRLDVSSKALISLLSFSKSKYTSIFI